MLGLGMGIQQSDRSGWDPPRCGECDDVIGVYEPLIHLSGGAAWRTSRAAEPAVSCSSGQCYHLDCYERLVGES